MLLSDSRPIPIGRGMAFAPTEELDAMEQSLAASSTLLPRYASTPRGTTLNQAPPSRGGGRSSSSAVASHSSLEPSFAAGAARAAAAAERLSMGQVHGSVDEIDAFVDSWQKAHPLAGNPPMRQDMPSPHKALPLAEQSLAGESNFLQLGSNSGQHPTRQSQQLPAFGSAWATDPFAALTRGGVGQAPGVEPQFAGIPEGAQIQEEDEVVVQPGLVISQDQSSGAESMMQPVVVHGSAPNI